MMRGFFMIELMLYVALGALLSALVFGHVQKIITYSAQLQKKSHVNAQVISALQYVAHDLRVAPAELVAWKTFSEHEIIWRQGGQDIGYSFGKSVLNKYVGSYDQTKDLWTQKKAYKVADQLEDVIFSVQHGGDYMTNVACLISAQGEGQKPYWLTVALRNGAVL